MTNSLKMEIWFWERITSPHMAGLLIALSSRGCRVIYVAERTMSEDRAKQGWSAPMLSGVELEIMGSFDDIQRLVASSSPTSIHICSGIRNNALVGVAQHVLAKYGRRQWVIMETIAGKGIGAILKRIEYRRLFMLRRNTLQGILAIGYKTADWVIERGMSGHCVFPFAYFLPTMSSVLSSPGSNTRFKFLYVGRLIPLKQVELLLRTLGEIINLDFELIIVGGGPLEIELKEIASDVLPGRVSWIGQLPMSMVPNELVKADCVVLPSWHDGWGAVVSESLMAGTQVVCSDKCGAAGAVSASGYGGVFICHDRHSLKEKLLAVLTAGPLSHDVRTGLSEWARKLGAEAGAEYLLNIFSHMEGECPRPAAPWEIGNAVI